MNGLKYAGFALGGCIAMFVAGWWGYELMLLALLGGIDGLSPNPVADSLEQMILHRLSVAASFSLLGLVLALGTIHWRRSKWRTQWPRRIAFALSVSILGSGCWMLFMRFKLSRIAAHAPEGIATFSLGLSGLHLYEVGLFASFLVLLYIAYCALIEERTRNAQGCD